MRRWIWVMLLLAACADVKGLLVREPRGDEVLLREAYRAADTLHAQLRSTEAVHYPLWVAACVESGNVEAASDVGRLLAEQVASRLGQLHYAVKDIQLRSQAVVLRPEGVFALSRRVDEVHPEAEGYAVMVGTYTRVGSRFFVNVRVVRSVDSVVLAAADMDLPAEALFPRRRLPYREPSVATSLGG